MASNGWCAGPLSADRRLGRFISRSFLLLILAVMYATSAEAACKGVLWVKVVDTRTSKLVDGVEVTLKGTAIKGVTDKDGVVGIELNEGDYTISLHKAECDNSANEICWRDG